MRCLVFILSLLVLSQAALAQTGTIKLLALSENPDGSSSGTLASLSLDIRPGAERVFLETIPLTKVATQISMRFAEQVACKELKVDCTHKDFVYTIVAGPGLVGGPSAGAAAAVLTASLLKGYELRDDMAITGTINSGGMIGPVGGIKEKIEAAGTQGITTVLLPRGTRVFHNSNVTLNLTAWGERNNVTVIEVATLDEALLHFSGKNITRALPAFTIDSAYQERMRAVAQLICKRMERFQEATADIDATDNESVIRRSTATNYSERAKTLGASGAYYSAASYCFRANVEYNMLHSRNATQFSDRIRNVFSNLAKLNKDTDGRELKTMIDLQTYMSVQERMIETADMLIDASEALQENRTEDATWLTVYAEERLVSARSWAAFFGLPGRPLVMDQQALRTSCASKLSEAEERFSYVRSFYPEALEDARITLDRAHRDAENASYALCLAKAAKAKAEADVILSASGFEQDQVQDLIALKQTIAQRQLVEAQQQGDFPLIGYNYYQYANDLKDEDAYSALLFSEYAIELSNLDIYFSKRQSALASFLDKEVVLPVSSVFLIILIAVSAGAALTSAYLLRRRARPHNESPVPQHRKRRRR